MIRANTDMFWVCAPHSLSTLAPIACTSPAFRIVDKYRFR